MPYYAEDLAYFDEQAGQYDLTCDECGERVGDTRDPEQYIGTDEPGFVNRLPEPLLCESCATEEA